MPLLTDFEQSHAIQNGADGWFAVLNTPAGLDFLEKIGKSLCKAQSRRDYEWLHEECHDHPCVVEGEYYFHRWDCPECMEAWKTELGGE